MGKTIRSEILFYMVQGGFFLIVLVIAIAIIIGFIPVKHPLFVKKAILLLQDMGADSCMVNSVEIIAWRGIEVHGVTFRVASDATNTCRIKIAKATIPMNFVQFLLYHKKVSRELRCVIKKQSPSFHSKYTSIGYGILAVGDILKEEIQGDFEDVWLEIKTGEKTAFLGVGGAISITVGDDKNNIALIHIDFPIVTTYGDGLQNIHCTAILSPDGTLDVKNLSGNYFDGKLRARGTIELLNHQTTSYSLLIDKMDMAYWYSVHVGIGEVTGSASVHCKGNNVPLDHIGRTVNCTVNINRCKVNNLPVQQSLATSLFIPSLTTVAFDKISFTAKRDIGDTVYATFDGEGDDIEFTTNGWVLINGQINQLIEGTFSEAMVKTFPPDLQPMLTSKKNQGWKFGCRLSGTYSDPRFELDKTTLQRVIRGLFQNFQQDIVRELMK